MSKMTGKYPKAKYLVGERALEILSNIMAFYFPSHPLRVKIILRTDKTTSTVFIKNTFMSTLSKFPSITIGHSCMCNLRKQKHQYRAHCNPSRNSSFPLQNHKAFQMHDLSWDYWGKIYPFSFHSFDSVFSHTKCFLSHPKFRCGTLSS